MTGLAISLEPMDSAPLDGETVWLSNECMEQPVLGHWVPKKNAWISDFTNFGDGTWFPCGKLVCPTRWARVDARA